MFPRAGVFGKAFLAGTGPGLFAAVRFATPGGDIRVNASLTWTTGNYSETTPSAVQKPRFARSLADTSTSCSRPRCGR